MDSPVLTCRLFANLLISLPALKSPAVNIDSDISRQKQCCSDISGKSVLPHFFWGGGGAKAVSLPDIQTYVQCLCVQRGFDKSVNLSFAYFLTHQLPTFQFSSFPHLCNSHQKMSVYQCGCMQIYTVLYAILPNVHIFAKTK